VNHRLPVPPGTNLKLILVPKAIVRRVGAFDPGEYYTHYVLPFLQADEIAHRGPLVQHRSSRAPYVTKKDLRARAVGNAKDQTWK
jgi:hypothetical protein